LKTCKMAANTTSAQPPLQNLRAMFYMVTPSESYYTKLDDVPNFVDNAIPYFLSMVALESVILKLQGKKTGRANDTLNSMTHGLLSGLMSVLFRSIELVMYTWIWENWRLVALPWDSPVTWICAFLGVDFCYYWFHRFSHESNIIWASHQVHHSSEDYNLSTALRQSMVQKYYSMFCYFPMALFIPPQAFYTHQQFNLLYQFWIHTEVIRSLGPLEYILNTASHHRVHHGRNPYCIDKNYAGTLIIWDRMFGTFQAEDEKVIYGLVHPNKFWDPIYGQFFHYLYILGLVKKYDSVTDKVSAVVKGPGWMPGKPWTGDHADLPKVKEPVKKYDSDVPVWQTIYIMVHFGLVLGLYSLLAAMKQQLSFNSSLAAVCFIIVSLQSFGGLYDHRSWGGVLESARCLLAAVCLGASYSGQEGTLGTLVVGLTAAYVTSAALWAVLSLRVKVTLQGKSTVKSKKIQ